MADSSLWNQSQLAFDEGHISDALTHTLAALKENPQDAALNYNAGNLNYRLGQFGASLAYLDHARYLAPRNKEILSAYSIAQSALFSSIGTRDLDPGATWYESLGETIPLDALTAFFSIGFFCCVYASLHRIKTGGIKKATLGVGATALFLCLTLGTGLFVFLRPKTNLAVCLEKTTLRSGPGESYLQLSVLDPGIRVRVTGKPGEWIPVRYAPNSLGWVKTSSMLLL